MSFSSPTFLFLFLPAFFLTYFALPMAWRNLALLIGSLGFYTIDGGGVTGVLLLSILFNQVIGWAVHRAPPSRGRLALLWFGVLINLAPLVYYKYWQFLLHVGHDALMPAGLQIMLSDQHIVLPAGISFFTFQGLSYLVDIYRGEIAPAGRIIDFGMYHTLFPQLIAGPIVRYIEVEDAIQRRPISIEDVESGIVRFCWGLGKKIIVADSMGPLADHMFALPADQLTGTAAWIGALAYTLQIFFDFSGYSDMAIGLGRMLGFRFPENFDQPYRSLSITEFWRRWHMTLSRWFRDYVYIPLGGNRTGPARTYLNLFAVFLLCGLWHGAAYTFVIWGAYHGVLLVIERIAGRRPPASGALPSLIRWARTFLLVVLGWVIFRVPSLEEAVTVFKAMAGFGPDISNDNVLALITADKITFFIVGAVIALLPAPRWITDPSSSVEGSLTGGARRALALALFAYSVILIAANGFNPLHLLPVLIATMWRFLFVATFFLLTLLPGLQMLTDAVPAMTVNENRVLAPGVSAATPLLDIPHVADRWFSDHFGLRSLLIRSKTQIDFSVFGTSDRVLVGRAGQLFYRSTTNDEVPAMNEYLATATAPAVDGVAALNRALADDGIHMALVVNMLSDRFYPDLLPRQGVRRPEHPRIDDLVAKLEAVPNLLVIDSKPILDEVRKTRRIFHKTDFHWNDPAAFAVAKTLVDRMGAVDGIASPWTYPLVVDTQRVSGGIAMFMPLFVPPSEQALVVEPTWQWPPGFVNLPAQPPFEFSSRADPNPDLLPPTVVVGDSFFDGMVRSGIQACFVEMHRIRWTATTTISDVVANLPPDTRWVIFEFIEVNRMAVGGFADAADIQKAVATLKRRGSLSQR